MNLSIPFAKVIITSTNSNIRIPNLLYAYKKHAMFIYTCLNIFFYYIIYLYKFNFFSPQKLRYGCMVGSPFVVFYIIGALLESRESYLVKVGLLLILGIALTCTGK